MPAWSVDGRHLAFLSDRDGSGETKLWIWDQATGKLRKLSDVGIRANQISWTPDGESIVTTIRNGDIRSDSDIECRSDLDTTSGSRRVAEASSVVVYEWNPNGKDGAQRPRGSLWNLDTKIRDLAEFDVETGRMKRLTHGARISVFRLSANGAEIGYTSATPV